MSEKITIDKLEYDELKKLVEIVTETLETKKLWQSQGYDIYDDEIAFCEKYLKESKGNEN